MAQPNGSCGPAPVAPSRRSHQVRRSTSSPISSADRMASPQQPHPVRRNNNNNNNNKPPPVPRNSLIRSSSNTPMLHHETEEEQVMTSSSGWQQPVTAKNNNNNSSSGGGGNSPPLADHESSGAVVERALASSAAAIMMAVPSIPPVPVSRSFTFQSPGGVRRRIPISPVLSTGVKTAPHQTGTRHDTVHYRQGTLVFPSSSGSDSGIVQGRLTLDLVAEPIESPPTTTSPPMSRLTGFFSHPLLTGHHHSNKPDESLLRLCQGGDAAAVSKYLSQLGYPAEKLPSRTANAVDSSGKSGFIHAAMTGNVAIVRMLVKLPVVDVNLADNEGNAALHLAAQAGHADVVSLLTLCPTLLIDSRNHAGITALMKAALQGRVRCTRLLLLAGASPVLRDFGRGACASEWARLTGRTKCVEIIDKYMEKMQLNPGLSPAGKMSKPSSSGGIWTASEPSLLLDQQQCHTSSMTSLQLGKESWVKSTLKKALHIVGHPKGRRGSGGADGVVASHLTGSSLLGPASILALPSDSDSITGRDRRSSLPSMLPSGSEKSPYWTLLSASPTKTSIFSIGDRPPPSRTDKSTGKQFVIPIIQVSSWVSPAAGQPAGLVPPPPASKAPPIPASVRTTEMRPDIPTRSRSKSTTRF